MDLSLLLICALGLFLALISNIGYEGVTLRSVGRNVAVLFVSIVVRPLPFTDSRKRFFFLFSAILLFSFLASPQWVRSEEPAETGLSILKFTAGVATSMLIHEGSHGLVAGVTGTRMTWKWGSYNQPLGFTEHAGSDEKGVAINASGLIFQEITSEVILQTKKIDKNDAYTRGIMAWNVINPILYTLDYWIFNVSNKDNGSSYKGDISGIEHYSNAATANGYALGVTAIALFQGYRFLKTQSWAPDWLRSETKQLFVAPSPSGGFFASYHVKF